LQQLCLQLEADQPPQSTFGIKESIDAADVRGRNNRERVAPNQPH
jgi:hypothetical protein